MFVVAVQAQPASSAPRQMATIAAATRAGRRRSFGGGASGCRGRTLRVEGPVDSGGCYSCSLPLSRPLLHEHLRFPDRDRGRPCRGRSAGWFLSVRRLAQVMTQSDVAVTVYFPSGCDELDFA